MKKVKFVAAIFGILFLAGCSSKTSTSDSKPNAVAGEQSKDKEGVNGAGPNVTLVQPGADAEKQAQEALILAEPGDVLEFSEGIFEFKGTLSLSGTENITIRGKGMDKSILNFTGQRSGSGGEGLKIKGNQFTISDICIQNAPGDAIKVEDSKGVIFRRVKTTWSRGPSEQNGAYGIYPVLCSDVLIEHCLAECASDAGIYVGQTERAVVRYNQAHRNVAGIEIENTIRADVYENEATDNAGGLLVFSLPGLKVKNGSHCRIFKNRVAENNHPNFASAGAIVSTVPSGTGLMIMANDQVEIFENDVRGNNTTNCAIVSFLITQKKFDDAAYDPFPEAIYVHDNRFSEGGKNPQGPIGKMFEQIAGLPMPDIVIDGVVNPNIIVDGRIPDQHRVYIANNLNATFANLGIAAMLQGGKPDVSRDVSVHAGKLPSLEPTVLAGVD